MRLPALLGRLWTRALTRWTRRRPKTTRPIRRPLPALAVAEDRAAPGSFLEAVLGIPLLGLVQPSAADPALVPPTGSWNLLLAALPDGGIDLDLPARAGAGDDWTPTAVDDEDPTSYLASDLDDLGAAPFDGLSDPVGPGAGPGDASGAGIDLYGVGVGGAADDTGSGGASAAADDLAAYSAGGGAGSSSTGSTTASTGTAGQDAPPAVRPAPDTSGILPDSRAAAFLDGAGTHGHRFGSALGALAGDTPGSLHARLHQSRTNATGVTGSLSPEALAGGQVEGLVGAVGDSVYDQQGTNPVGGDGDGSGGGVAAGRMAMMSSPTPGNTLSGSFTFTLTVSGTDDQGAYALSESGTGTISDGEPVTGSVTVSSQIRRGGGEPTGDDPTTTETLAFDPAGSGLVFGFDVDGYNAGAMGVTVASAASYSLSGSGSTSFSDYSTETTTTNPETGETDTDTTTESDSGGETFSITVTGSGASRSYVTDDTTTAEFTDTVDETDVVAAGGESDSETYDETDEGSDTETDHEEGTLAADGTAAMSSFRVGDTTTDTDTVSDGGTDALTADGEVEGDQYQDTDTVTGSTTTTVTGTPAGWSLTLDGGYDDDFTDSDSGFDHTDTVPAGGGLDDEVNQYHDSNTGHDHQTVRVGATSQGDQVTITSLDVTDVGWDTFDDGDTDAETESLTGGDTDNETFTETVVGRDDFTLTLSGSDAAGFTASERESVADRFTDGDVGGDTWDDPADGGGDEEGSDTYSVTDSGNEASVVTTQGTVDADGNFTLTGFDADVRDTGVTFNADDSGDDDVTAGGETDDDVFEDHAAGTDDYHLHVALAGGQTTVGIEETTGGRYRSSDTETDDTPRADGTGEDEETDARRDDDTATAVSTPVAGVDADGDIVVTGGTVRVKGLDTETEDDRTDTEQEEDGSEEDVVEDEYTSGTDDYDVRVTRQDGVVTALSDDETVDDTVRESDTITPENPAGAETDTGTALLSGTVHGDIHQTGQAVDGQLQLDPANGGDRVDLTGEMHDTKVTHQSSATPIGIGTAIEGLDIFVNPTPTVTTQLDDAGLVIKETDVIAGGVAAVQSVEYRDAPAVTVTTVYDYAGTYDLNPFVHPGASITLTGGETIVDRESDQESVVGAGAAATVNRTTTKRVTDTLSASGTGSYGVAMTASGYKEDKTTHVIAGTESGPADETLTDTTTDHHEFQDTAVWTIPAPLCWGGYSMMIARAGHAETYDRTSVEEVTDGDPELLSLSGSGTTEGLTLEDTFVGPGGSLRDTWAFTTTKTESLVDGQAEVDLDRTIDVRQLGNDPATGAAVDSTVQFDEDSPPAAENTGDWFAAVSDFSAAVSDKITGGLTKRVRQGLGYDDAVNYNSRAYAAGEVAGEVLDQALQAVPVCRAAGLAKKALKGYHGVQSAANAIDAGEAFANKDVIGGLNSLMQARSSFNNMLKSCFVAGTPLLTPDGSKAIEAFQAGDLILSRDENDPDSPVVVRRVVQTFVRVSPVLNLHAGGRIIGTSGEHPFWVEGRGWVEAGRLRIGDVLVSHRGERVPVEGIADSGRVETVYNLEVEGDHTYFVGTPGWGFDLWSHNTDCAAAVQRSIDRHKKKLEKEAAYAAREAARQRAAAATGVGQRGEVVRRFGSKKGIKDAREAGIPFDPTKGTGIPTTTTRIKAVNPGRIKQALGAVAAEAYADFDISGKPVIRRRTKAGKSEIVVLADLLPQDLRGFGKVKRK